MEWEYRVENIRCLSLAGKVATKKMQDLCDKLGKEGWELVNFQIYDVSSKMMAVFKRQIKK